MGYQIEHGNTYIDGKDINGLNEAVINDRRILTEDGMLTIAIAIDSKTNQLIVPPTFYTKGLVNQSSEKIMDECRLLVEQAIRKTLQNKTTYGELKNITVDEFKAVQQQMKELGWI